MKKSVTLLTVALLLSLPQVVHAETVSGVKYLNNSEKNIDYKLSSERKDTISKSLNVSSSFMENLTTEATRNLEGLSKEQSYLIENNILTRDNNFKATKDSIKLTQNTFGTPNDYIKKSDFLIALYKAKYGVIESRPLAINTYSYRFINDWTRVSQTNGYIPSGYKGNSSSFDFFEGDYNIYVNPNVYELYFSKLLDKKIISLSDIKDLGFINEYKLNDTYSNIGKKLYPSWRNDLNPYYVLSGKTNSVIGAEDIAGSSVFGKGYNLVSGDDGSITMSKKEPNFFYDENLTTIDALKYIESVVRLTEKDMTATEAKIVTYKYGVSYLNNLPDEDKTTVSFLVAKGILNFENRSEFGSLYTNLDFNMFVKLIYRLYNVNARVDFSKIQLTDSDNFWLEKGFSQENLKLYRADTFPYVTTDSVKEVSDVAENVSIKKESTMDKLLKFFGVKRRENIYAAPSDNQKKKKYSIIKSFPKDSRYTYKGKLLSDWREGEVTPYNNPLGNKNIVSYTFTIESYSVQGAMVSIDSCLETDIATAKLNSNIGIVTKLEGDGKTTTLISATGLKTALSEIQVLNDKVLRNRVTGAMAILLPDSDIALVGNEVITTKDVIVFAANKEVYYNLDIIVSLMSNMYLSSIDRDSAYVCQKVVNEHAVPVISSTGSEIERNFIATFKDLPSASDALENKTVFNLSNLTRGITTLIKDYSRTVNGSTIQAKLIVDWKYVAPPNDTAFTGVIENKNPDIKAMSEFLFTRPKDDTNLAKWWDSNIGMSDALCNLIYGTKGIKYIKSGYLTPSITILCSHSDQLDTIKAEISNQIQFDDLYAQQFLKDNPKDFLNFFFKQSDGTAMYDILSQARTFMTYTSEGASSLSGGCRAYGGQYVVTNSNIIYKSVTDDTRVDYRDDKLYVKTRTADIFADDSMKIVTLNGKKYYHDGLSANNGVAAYFRLIALDSVVGTLTKNSSGYTVTSGGEDAIMTEINSITRGLPSTTFGTMTDYKYISKLPPKTYSHNGVYVAEGKAWDVSYEGAVVTPLPDDKLNDYVNKTAYSNPVIYLDRTKWVLKDGEMKQVQTYPYLQNGNIFYSGINNSMIDKIISKSVDAKPINQLKQGDKVLIGDILFQRTNTGLVSYPVKSASLIEGIKQDVSKPSGPITNLFSGLNLDYSGISVPFSSYIKEAKIGTLLDKAVGERILYSKGALRVRDGTKDIMYSSGEIVKSVSINISVTDDILCRQIDDKENMYVLLATSEKYGEGYLDNLPFFTESLGLRAGDDIYLGVQKIKFSPVAEANELRDKFKRDFELAIRGDFKSLMKVLCYMVLSYLILMSWVCYPVLNLDLGKPLLYAIRDPIRTSNRNGLDLIKIISIGMYNLDMRIQPAKLVISNLLMFGIIYVMLKFL